MNTLSRSQYNAVMTATREIETWLNACQRLMIEITVEDYRYATPAEIAGQFQQCYPHLQAIHTLLTQVISQLTT